MKLREMRAEDRPAVLDLLEHSFHLREHGLKSRGAADDLVKFAFSLFTWPNCFR